MALSENSGLQTITLVLTKSQTRRLRALAALRSTEWRRVSISDVAREVVEEGLPAVSAARDTAFSTSGTEREVMAS